MGYSITSMKLVLGMSDVAVKKSRYHCEFTLMLIT